MKQISKQMLQTACQPHKEQFSKQDNGETQRKADHLWDLMTELYTDKWIKKNGAVASSIWIEAISTLSGDQLRKGVNKCKEQIFNGNAWAPDLADFLALIHGQTDVDYHAAFMRCLDRKPQGRVEQWVYETVGYNIRVSTHEAAERMHKKLMKEAILKEQRGELKLQSESLKALPVNSVKNVNDLEREKYEETNGKALHPRIAKILQSKDV